MDNVNTVCISGNLTRAPEYKQVNAEFAVAKLGVAVNRSKKNAEGGYDEIASFFDVDVLGQGFSQLVCRKLKTGDSVTVQGRLEQQRWETPEGEKRSKVIVVATQINAEGFFRSKDEDQDFDKSGTNGGYMKTPAPAAESEVKPPAAPTTTQGTSSQDIPF